MNRRARYPNESGRREAGGVRDVLIARLLSDGSLDPEFGAGGMQTASWSELDDLTRSLTIMPDGDLVVLGVTREEVEGETIQDLALARFNGDTPPVANESTPEATSALSVGPNPVRNEAQVRFELAEAGPVELTVVDLLGRRVATLLDGDVYPAGAHAVSLDANSFPSGVYLVRLVVSGDPAGGASRLATHPLTIVR